MQPDFWLDRWQQNQIGFHQQNINLHLQQCWPALGIPVASRVFVPLCGKSSDMLWLRAQGCHVVGVELSALAVKAFFDENDVEYRVYVDGPFHIYEADGLSIYCGDFFDLTTEILAGVIAVFDRASLIALPPDMRVAYVAYMRKILDPGTKTLLVAFDYPQHEMQGPPFSVQEPEIHALYDATCEVDLLCTLDILEQESRFRDKGVTRLQEKVYLLTYNHGKE